MLELPEIKKIIEESGLNAQFRQHEKEDWDRVVKKSSFVPTVYAWDFLNYNTVYFHSFSESSTDISLVIYHDKNPCAVWPLVFDPSDKEPLKTVNKLYGGIVAPPLFVDNFPKKSQRAIIKSCIKFLNDTENQQETELLQRLKYSLDNPKYIKTTIMKLQILKGLKRRLHNVEIRLAFQKSSSSHNFPLETCHLLLN